MRNRTINTFRWFLRRSLSFLVSAKPTNGRVLFSTNYTATLQWDPPTDVACGLTHQIVNCSYLNTSLTITVRHQRPGLVAVDRLKPSTKHACYSVFVYSEGHSARSDEIIFWTKPTGILLCSISLSNYTVVFV